MSSPESVSRSQRVAERVREELVRMLLGGEVRDPGVHGTYVSAVQMSPDLKLAKVYVCMDPAASLTVVPSEHHGKEMLAALARASGFLRTTLAKRLGLRYVPALRFYIDTHTDQVERVERIFEEMHASSTDTSE